jgi:hypothetical protein
VIPISRKKKSRRPSKGDLFIGRRTGTEKQVVGFSKTADGIERVKLLDLDTGKITLSKVDTLHKNYT